jgi:uncharacterized protein
MKETIMEASTGKGKRGFASMDPAKQKKIASSGGKAAHEQGKAHEFTSEEARVAGRKGGKAAHAKGAAHEFSSAEAKEAGKKGGKAAHEKGVAHQFTPEEAKAAGKKKKKSSLGRARACARLFLALG